MENFVNREFSDNSVLCCCPTGVGWTVAWLVVSMGFYVPLDNTDECFGFESSVCHSKWISNLLARLGSHGKLLVLLVAWALIWSPMWILTGLQSLTLRSPFPAHLCTCYRAIWMHDRAITTLSTEALVRSQVGAHPEVRLASVGGGGGCYWSAKWHIKGSYLVSLTRTETCSFP